MLPRVGSGYRGRRLRLTATPPTSSWRKFGTLARPHPKSRRARRRSRIIVDEPRLCRLVAERDAHARGGRCVGRLWATHRTSGSSPGSLLRLPTSNFLATVSHPDRPIAHRASQKRDGHVRIKSAANQRRKPVHRIIRCDRVRCWLRASRSGSQSCTREQRAVHQYRYTERRRDGARRTTRAPRVSRAVRAALTVDRFMPKRQRTDLAAALNALLASPTFATWPRRSRARRGRFGSRRGKVARPSSS